MDKNESHYASSVCTHARRLLDFIFMANSCSYRMCVQFSLSLSLCMNILFCWKQNRIFLKNGRGDAALYVRGSLCASSKLDLSSTRLYGYIAGPCKMKCGRYATIWERAPATTLVAEQYNNDNASAHRILMSSTNPAHYRSLDEEGGRTSASTPDSASHDVVM